jgi:glycine cleavage system H protein
LVRVRGFEFPEDRLYDVPNQVWYAPQEDGTLRAGLTPVAVDLAGDVLVFTPRRIGRDFEKGRSFATIETGKWVGAVRAAFAGVVVAHNEAMVAQPRTINRDAYGEGWLLLVRPADADWREGLVTGAAVGAAFEAWMDGEGHPGREG